MATPYPNYITPEGFAKLRADYDHLLGVEPVSYTHLTLPTTPYV